MGDPLFEGFYVRAFLICDEGTETETGQQLHSIFELPVPRGRPLATELQAYIAISHNDDREQHMYQLVLTGPDGASIRSKPAPLPPSDGIEPLSFFYAVPFQVQSPQEAIYRLELLIDDRVVAWVPFHLQPVEAEELTD